MLEYIGAGVLFLMALVSFILSVRAFMKKGFLINNAYIYNLAVSCELEFKLNPPKRQQHPHGQQHSQHQHPHQHHHHK